METLLSIIVGAVIVGLIVLARRAVHQAEVSALIGDAYLVATGIPRGRQAGRDEEW
jgi:hypothetical protein